jgi:hypothetical protein
MSLPRSLSGTQRSRLLWFGGIWNSISLAISVTSSAMAALVVRSPFVLTYAVRKTTHARCLQVPRAISPPKARPQCSVFKMLKFQNGLLTGVRAQTNEAKQWGLSLRRELTDRLADRRTRGTAPMHTELRSGIERRSMILRISLLKTTTTNGVLI